LVRRWQAAKKPVAKKPAAKGHHNETD